MSYKMEYDVIVVGAGHAGCEAAAAAANMGSKTLLITSDMEKFANMSCNPAVGGVAKGQIVREIDALGGYMGIITDQTTIQFRMLNLSKGPAMWSPRAQCDKSKFSLLWRKTLENIPNLFLFQDTVSEIIFDQNKHTKTITGVRTVIGIEFFAKSVILTNGTFLNGRLHVGQRSTPGGRIGEGAAFGITEQLTSLGFQHGRMKTGTPARIDARTVDLDKLTAQYGDENPLKFSFLPEIKPVDAHSQLPCYTTETSLEVHDILRSGFKDSPMYSGIITGIGPRYCPSVEDKLRTFADKESHQIMLEPEGADTNELYVNGFSSSLPWQVQVEALRKIKGLENAHLYRTGYAIEYDYFPPTQLKHTLETKLIDNLYFAGQINGTTGYEEAGAQGLMAGVNAHLKNSGKPTFILNRNEAYIGVLIDDLVIKGVDEPYRMFTSRAEYRTLLRQDNADIRLTKLSHTIGLADGERLATVEKKIDLLNKLILFINDLSVKPEDVNPYLQSIESSPLEQGRKLLFLILRNDIFIAPISYYIPSLKAFLAQHNFTPDIIEQAEIEIKYRGYIERERHTAAKLSRLENIFIKPDFDYHSISSLTIEARQKLSKIKPSSIGQASRIPGISPADINVLLIYFGR